MEVVMNSPCTKVCKIKEGICTGCHRTLEQIGAWGSMTDKERQEAMRELKWPVAVVDRVGIMQRLPPYTNLPEGTKLYTHPASRQAVSVPEETLTAIHDTLRLVWSRELSADDGLDEIEILIPPTKADEWIKCSERLPSEADHYLVALSDPEDVGWVTDKAWTAFYNKCGECPEIAVEIVENGQPVTHWMPLPAPPQEQGQ